MNVSYPHKHLSVLYMYIVEELETIPSRQLSLGWKGDSRDSLARATDLGTQLVSGPMAHLLLHHKQCNAAL